MSNTDSTAPYGFCPEKYREWWTANTTESYGSCWCGCGKRTNVARQNLKALGHVRGEPYRYYRGHGQKRPPAYDLESGARRCCRCREWLPATPEFFYRNPVNKDGYARECKSCARPYQLAYYQRNREELIRKSLEWSKTHPERRKDQHYKRRAAKHASPTTHTFEDVWEMYDSQQGLCAYCESPLFGCYHVDHMVPLSRGGHDGWENLAIACIRCNTSKGALTAEEFVCRLRNK